MKHGMGCHKTIAAEFGNKTGHLGRRKVHRRVRVYLTVWPLHVVRQALVLAMWELLPLGTCLSLHYIELLTCTDVSVKRADPRLGDRSCLRSHVEDKIVGFQL